MPDQFTRTELLLGADAMDKLGRARVAVFGIGGVGGYVCEALARSGIGSFDLIDNDRVSLTNLNRQIIATWKTMGQYKVDAMHERILEINPEARVKIYRTFFLPENADEFPFGEYDYVVDAVDTVTAKLSIIMKAREAGIPVISSMGAGNKLDGSRFRVADIYETKVCPLAKVMRRELKKRGVEKLKVVYSEELPVCPANSISEDSIPEKNMWETGGPDEVRSEETAQNGNKVSPSEKTSENTVRRSIPGSVAFVPSVAGLILAGEVIKDLCGIHS